MGRNSDFHTGRTYQSDIEPVTAHVAAQYHNEHGGASFNSLTGDRAAQGYAIGGMRKVAESHTNSPDISATEFQAHRDRVRSAYPNNEKAFAGTWRNDEGKSIFDASQVEKSRSKAAKLQTKRGEDEVFNLGKQKGEDLRPKALRSKRDRG